jgi:serine/threonine protein kinase
MNDPRNNSDYETQLTDLENRLNSPAKEEEMLGEVGVAMRQLLAENDGSEGRIRQILDRQFDQGNLRKESYELVEKLLSKLAAESEKPDPAETVADEPYTRTAVIEQPGAEPQELMVTNQLQIGTVLRDRYLLKQAVSEGSMGIVYKALDRRLAEAGEKDAFVAIKVINPKLSRNAAALRALQQEAAKGRCLSHSNIVRFIDLDRDDQLYFIVMEWLEGRSLSRILDESRGDAIDFDMALDIVHQAASALEYAHQRGVVHADVKPGNIMITPEGEVKLIDFGVARVRQKENEGRSRFDPDIIRAATPAYSSMQVLTGDEPVAADDVFSLSCLFYRLIAGYRVFGPRNAADAAEQGMEPQQPDGITDEQWSALRKALAYSRVTRFQSPTDFVDALGQRRVVTAKPPEPEEIEVEATTLVAPVKDNPEDSSTEIRVERESIMYEPESKPRRSPWRVAVIGIIIVGSVAVVIETGVIDTITDVGPGIGTSSTVSDEAAAISPGPLVEELEPIPEVDISTTNVGADEELVVDADSGTLIPADGTEEVDIEADAAGLPPDEPVVAAEETIPLVDFSSLPPPSVILALPSSPDEYPIQESLIVREEGGDAIIDLMRGGDLSQAFSVRFVETEFSGSESAWQSGRYSMENDGVLTFETGQPRARINLFVRPDAAREADREVVLTIREATDDGTDLGSIRMTLEDDDQRAFEAAMPANTVAFTVNQVTVREFDPAAQIDVVRYRSDNRALEVRYRLTDVTATEGQDYFGPGLPLIYFAPGQQAARILIPLGQDGRPERNETFEVALEGQDIPEDSGIFSRLTVMIRDDDT